MPRFVARYDHGPHSVGLWTFRAPTLADALDVAGDRFGDALLDVGFIGDDTAGARDRFARGPWPGAIADLARKIGATLGR